MVYYPLFYDPLLLMVLLSAEGTELLEKIFLQLKDVFAHKADRSVFAKISACIFVWMVFLWKCISECYSYKYFGFSGELTLW